LHSICNTDSVFNSFRETYHHSVYLAALNKDYDAWLAIAPGKPAPKLEGYTLDGTKVSIKDLRGKVIYMDVWATWCGPCVAEIPASKKLQQEFAGDDRIQFLNVSVDSRKPDWQNFLANDKAWKGLHINIKADKIDSLYLRYKLLGVPTYILIDQLGNIVNMKAPRPSEAQTMTEIRKLLAKEL
jgi:thiol-disulfide isomerase/thioredoxin